MPSADDVLVGGRSRVEDVRPLYGVGYGPRGEVDSAPVAGGAFGGTVRVGVSQGGVVGYGGEGYPGLALPGRRHQASLYVKPSPDELHDRSRLQGEGYPGRHHNPAVNHPGVLRGAPGGVLGEDGVAHQGHHRDRGGAGERLVGGHYGSVPQGGGGKLSVCVDCAHLSRHLPGGLQQVVVSLGVVGYAYELYCLADLQALAFGLGGYGLYRVPTGV